MMTDGARDFDFEFGSWTVQHRRMKARLCNCAEWETFSGTSEVRPILGGHGNVEDNVLHFANGTYRAIALRSFDPAQGTWAIWWLDARAPHSLDVPVVGRFTHGIGQFYADDTHDGRPVKLRFQWHQNAGGTPRWEQALSPDGGTSWETNWIMDFHPA